MSRPPDDAVVDAEAAPEPGDPPPPPDAPPAGGPSGGTGPRVPPTLVVLGVVVAALVVGLAVVAVVRTRDRDDGPGLEGAEAADALVEAYTRHLDATFRVEGTFTRTLPDGRTLTSGYLSVQLPPDHVQRALGSTTGVVGGRTVNCSTSEDGTYSCAATGSAVDRAEERATILDALDSYVRGTDPVYEVTGDGEGCFDLLRRRTELEATYGRRARLCVDAATGAIRRLEVEREGGAVDELLAEVITDQVTPADFDLGEDDTYDPDVPGDAGTPPTTP